MRKEIAKKQKKTKTSIRGKYALQLILVGAVTGVFAGAVTSLFNILAHIGEAFSRGAYAFVRENPAFIPLLVLALGLGAFFIGVFAEISFVTRGCGIPQAEGATRGFVRFRWFKDATATFASCLLSIFLGLSIGAEGPSVLIGACVGDGVASTTHRNEMIKRYQITGGACTGLAVAGNAPLTGIIFAFEEAHKRFTPEVFICAFSSVIFGMLTRTAIYSAFGLNLEVAFGSYAFFELPLTAYAFVVLSGAVCGLFGVLFYKACFWVRRLFKKIQTKKTKYNHAISIAIAVLLGGIVSFVATGVMGGGHELIHSLGSLGGTGETHMQSVWGLSLVLSLVIILVLKFLITTVNVGAGIPCGIFIPIIATGACLGGLLNSAWTALGMDGKYADLMIMLCMSAYFATIVKAPLTAIVMICEFTGSFAPLLPVVIAVSIGYIIGDIFRLDGIYEELLEIYERESGFHEQAVREVYTFTVTHGAIAEKREIRDVLWPSGARVVEIKRGDEVILPDGDTVLVKGDILTIVCKTPDHQKVKDELTHILGE